MPSKQVKGKTLPINKNTYSINKLTRSQKYELARILYSNIQRKVFNNFPYKLFLKSVISPKNNLTRIKIDRDRSNRIIGYASFHVYTIHVNDVKYNIVMAEMAKTDSLAKTHPFIFILSEIFKFKLRNLFHPMFLVETIVSPYVYYLLEQLVTDIYPSPRQSTPDEISQFSSVHNFRV